MVVHLVIGGLGARTTECGLDRFLVRTTGDRGAVECGLCREMDGRRHVASGVLGMKLRRYGDALLICLGDHADDAPCCWRWWGPVSKEAVKPPPRILPDRHTGAHHYLNGYPELAIRPCWELLDDLTFLYLMGQHTLATLGIELDFAVMVEPEVAAPAAAPEMPPSELLERAATTPV